MFGKSKLTMKFTAGFLLLGALICGASSLIGYHQYKEAIQKQYNDRAYRCADVALSYVETEDLRNYAEAVRGLRAGTLEEEEAAKYRDTEAYEKTAGQIRTLREKMGANDVFIFCVDLEELRAYDGNREGWLPLLYIFDSYTVPEYSYTLGDAGGFNPKYIRELEQIALTGEHSENYFISEGDYGYNTSAILPVSENGEVLALAAVEIPMVTLQAALRQYIIYAVLVTMVLIVFFILLYMLYLFRKVVAPINLITSKTEGFVHNHNQISTELQKINSKDEIQALADGVLKMQTDINAYIENLTRVTAEKERIGAELGVATQIQASMLPCIFPAFPGRPEFDIYATMEPAKEVGGDFYDFFLVDENHLALVIADVSGKGVPAALFMVIAKTLLKNAAQTGASPKEVLEKVNNQLCENNEAEMFVTVWLGILEISTGKMVCANAGHEYPALYRAGEKFELVKDRHGFVLAGMEGSRYREYELTLGKGDCIYVYTDGVAEATNAAEELYGTERMIGALNGCPETAPEKLLTEVKKDVDRFVGEAPQFDDITMLGLVYYGPGEKGEEA